MRVGPHAVVEFLNLLQLSHLEHFEINMTLLHPPARLNGGDAEQNPLFAAAVARGIESAVFQRAPLLSLVTVHCNTGALLPHLQFPSTIEYIELRSCSASSYDLEQWKLRFAPTQLVNADFI